MFLLLTIESIFPPIPSEVVLTFGGFMTEHTSLTLTGMVIAATAGSTAGAMLLYLTGRLIPLERLERILSKRWIQKIGFKAEDLNAPHPPFSQETGTVSCTRQTAGRFRATPACDVFQPPAVSPDRPAFLYHTYHMEPPFRTYGLKRLFTFLGTKIRKNSHPKIKFFQKNLLTKVKYF